ncbi:response regulator [candidate division WOR-3 bacterium]|nr:response regulator [candidate division WOR-3 bacterium]
MNERARILFVDDERKFADAMAKVLRYGDFNVQTAYSGSQALDFYQSESFDLVITDLKMPVMDGIELIRRIKQINQDQLILVITAFPTQCMPWNRRFSESGAPELDLETVNYLVKPFTPKRLIEVVEKTFREKDVALGRKVSVAESADETLTSEEEMFSHEPVAGKTSQKVVKPTSGNFISNAALEILEESSGAVGAPAVCALVGFDGVTIAEVNTSGMGKDAYSGKFADAMKLLRKTLAEVGSGHLNEGTLKLDKHWILVRFLDRANCYLCIVALLGVPIGTLRTVAKKTVEGLSSVLEM